MVGVEVDAGVFPHYSSGVMATLFNRGGWLSYQKMQSAEFTGGEDRLRTWWGNFHHLLFHLQLSTRLHLKASALPRINTLRQHWLIHMCHAARVHSMYENTYMWCSRSVLLNSQHAKTSAGVTSSLIHANGKIHSSIFSSWIGVSIDTLGAMQFCSRRRGNLLRCCDTACQCIKLCVCKCVSGYTDYRPYICAHNARICIYGISRFTRWVCVW